MTQPSILANKTIAFEIFNDEHGPHIVTMDVSNNVPLAVHPAAGLKEAAVGTEIKMILHIGNNNPPLELSGEVTTLMSSIANGLAVSPLRKNSDGVLQYITPPLKLDCLIYPTPDIIVASWTRKVSWHMAGHFEIQLTDNTGELRAGVNLEKQCLHVGDTLKYRIPIDGKIHAVNDIVTKELVAQLSDPNIEVIKNIGLPVVARVTIDGVIPYATAENMSTRMRLVELVYDDDGDGDFISANDLENILANERAAIQRLYEKENQKTRPDPLLCSHSNGYTSTEALDGRPCEACKRHKLSIPGPLPAPNYLKKWDENRLKHQQQLTQSCHKIERRFMREKCKKLGIDYEPPQTPAPISEPVVET